MNNDLISRKWLTDAIRNRRTYLSYEDAKDVIDLIDNAPSINPCDNCDLYFKATTKEIDRWYKKEEQKGGVDNVMCVPELYQGCLSCDAHNHCFDAFCSNAVNCNAYGKGGAEWQKQQ